MTEASIKITDLLGSSLGLSAEDGQQVFLKVTTLLREGYRVTLSFEGLTTITSLFLDVAVGQICGFFDINNLRDRLLLDGLGQDDLELVKKVVDNAKEYYRAKVERLDVGSSPNEKDYTPASLFHAFRSGEVSWRKAGSQELQAILSYYRTSMVPERAIRAQRLLLYLVGLKRVTQGYERGYRSGYLQGLVDSAQ